MISGPLSYRDFRETGPWSGFLGTMDKQRFQMEVDWNYMSVIHIEIMPTGESDTGFFFIYSFSLFFFLSFQLCPHLKFLYFY